MSSSARLTGKGRREDSFRCGVQSIPATSPTLLALQAGLNGFPCAYKACFTGESSVMEAITTDCSGGSCPAAGPVVEAFGRWLKNWRKTGSPAQVGFE